MCSDVNNRQPMNSPRASLGKSLKHSLTASITLSTCFHGTNILTVDFSSLRQLKILIIYFSSMHAKVSIYEKLHIELLMV